MRIRRIAGAVATVLSLYLVACDEDTGELPTLPGPLPDSGSDARSDATSERTASSDANGSDGAAVDPDGSASGDAGAD